jgi:hypothetical protein
MGFEAKSEGAVLGLTKEALVELTFVFIRDFATRLEEGGKEMCRVGRDGRRLWDEGWHVGCGYCSCHTIVKYDEILQG